MEFRKFSSIEQFRNVIKQVQNNSQYHGIENPTITFTGTVKVHGTNACVVYDVENGEYSYQSRERTLTLQQDNAGFMLWAMNKIYLKTLTEMLVKRHEAKKSVHIYGEWAGGNIQKGVAVSQLQKAFYVFNIVIDGETDVDMDFLFGNSIDVHNIMSFKTWKIDIDFSRPDLVQNYLVEETIKVEDECPVGKAFGVSGIGEGIVWKSEGGLIFKTKGEKHSASKVKTVKQIAAVDIEKMNSMTEFIDLAASENRLQQGLQKLREAGLDSTDNKNIGEFIKWVAGDIFREEADTIVENQFDSKKLGGLIATKARNFYMNQPV